MNFPAELKRLRERAGISQSELARRVGVPPGMICRIERGKKVMLETAERLLGACGAVLIIKESGYPRYSVTSELLGDSVASDRIVIQALRAKRNRPRR